MKKSLFLLSALSIVLLLGACSKQSPISSEMNKPAKNELTKNSTDLSESDMITVMTRNIYVGANVDVILSATNPNDIPILAAQAFQEMQNTKFPERALALAKEIFETKPHLVGLQEVSLFRIQTPGDAVYGGTVPATVVYQDFLEILMTVLEEYGLQYEIAGIIENADVEIPMLTGQNPMTFSDIRLTDHDVVLARNDVQISEVMTKRYTINLVAPDVGIEVPRGFVALTATINGNSFRFANTHLEVAWNEDALKIQMAQAQELLMHMMPVKNMPVILAGDFNSPAPHGETYRMVTARNKYTDVWTRNEWDDNPDGFTYGHDPDLMNEESAFWERIDFIFVRNRIPGHRTPVFGPFYGTVVGDEQEDRTPSGLWPSDHGGVVAWMHVSMPSRFFAQN